MDKIVVGAAAADAIDINATVETNIQSVAAALGKRTEDLTACILDRPRHTDLVEQVRSAGARIKYISDGDVAGAIMAATPDTGVDIALGVGGTPEGVLTACALRALGGAIQAKLWFADDKQRQRALDAQHDLNKVLTTNDLVKSEDAFFVCTGITDGELLEGVRYTPNGASTESLVLRARSGTIRSVHSEHALSKVRNSSGGGCS